MLSALLNSRWTPSLQETLGDVELPSDVSALPVDFLAWIILAFGVFLFMHLYAKWLIHERSAAPAVQPEAPILDSSSFEDSMKSLRASVQSLSSSQQDEALALSMFVRRVNGEQWSATDEELLAKASPASRDTLKPILLFTTRILFARCHATPEQWNSALDHLEAWMKRSVENQG